MRKSWLGPRCTGRYGDIKNNHYDLQNRSVR